MAQVFLAIRAFLPKGHILVFTQVNVFYSGTKFRIVAFHGYAICDMYSGLIVLSF
jgi:hypothetical protein